MDISKFKKGDVIMFAGVVSNFNKDGVEEDSRGNMPMAITPLCGTSPRTLNVVAGTVAQTASFEAGERYAVQAIYMGEYEDEETGEKTHSFNFSNAGKISFSELREWKKDEPLDVIIPMRDDANPVIEGENGPEKVSAKEAEEVDNEI